MPNKSFPKKRVMALLLSAIMLLSSAGAVYAQQYEASDSGSAISDSAGAGSSYIAGSYGSDNGEDYGLGDIDPDDQLTLTPETGIDEDGNYYVINPEIPVNEAAVTEAQLPAPSVAPLAQASAFALSVPVNDSSEFTAALNSVPQGGAAIITLGADITLSEPVTINQRNITIDTNGNTLNINVSGSASHAVRVDNGSLTVNGGGTVNVNAAGNVHVALDVWNNSTVSVASDTLMNLSNTGTGPTATGHQRRGIRALQQSTVTIFGDITVDGSGIGTRMGATGIRARAATVTVNGNVSVSGEYSVGIFVYLNEGSTVIVTGNVTATGANSQSTLAMQGETSMGTGTVTIIIAGQPVTPMPPLGGGVQQPPGAGVGVVTVPAAPPVWGSRAPSPAPGSPAHSFSTGMGRAHRTVMNIRRNASNDITADYIISAVRSVLPPGVTAEWSPYIPFNIVPATDDTPGRITGLINITGNNHYRSAINFWTVPIAIPALGD